MQADPRRRKWALRQVILPAWAGGLNGDAPALSSPHAGYRRRRIPFPR
jgi:hypothetical protein